MKGRILVIEDDPPSLELLRYLLSAFGYEVLSAVDGEAGLEQAARERPDLVVCDLQIPRLDGFAVADRLKGDPDLRRIPLVAVTASAMNVDRAKVFSSGFDGYITKPIDPHLFVREVEAFLPAAGKR